ncbi:MAG: YqaE/Pmp3 family membrane protein [Bacteroidota bacterium]
MKPIFKFFIGSLLAVFILQSCGTSKFGKSHYKHRDWVWVGSEKNEEAVVNETGKTDDVKEEPVQKIQLRKPEKPAVYPNPVIEEEKKTENTVSENVLTEKTTVDEIKTEEAENGSVSVAENETTDDTKDEQAANADADTMFILMIIFAFFLPPLAVYLKEQASGMFWITLVLCLLAGGFGIGIYGGLWGLWGVAVVLALLRVLDII